MEKYNKFGYIIFVRLGSKRLPGKALRKINNKPILGYIIERVKKIKPNYKIIIATTSLKRDKQIVNYCKKMKISYFTGSNNNVMLRAIKCCEKYNIEAFLRICADRLYFDFNLATKMLKIFKKNNFDIITNSLKKTFPRGMTCEIIRYDVLKKSFKFVKRNQDKEHICDYFYRYKKNFKIKNIISKYNKKVPMLNLAIDNLGDLTKAEKCLKNFKYKTTIHNNKVISYYLKN